MHLGHFLVGRLTAYVTLRAYTAGQRQELMKKVIIVGTTMPRCFDWVCKCIRSRSNRSGNRSRHRAVVAGPPGAVVGGVIGAVVGGPEIHIITITVLIPKAFATTIMKMANAITTEFGASASFQ